MLLVGLLVVVSCGGGDEKTLGEGANSTGVASSRSRKPGSGSGNRSTQNRARAPTEPGPVTCLLEGADAIVLVQVRDGDVFHSEPGSSSRVGEDVADLGEDAYSSGDDVDFLQNDWSVSVSVIFGLVDEAALIEIAQIVSDRLP